jgi:hypothetical protein
MATPTWQNPISGYFTTKDVGCMSAFGIHLDQYASVKTNAQAIYGKVSTGQMPLHEQPWSQQMISTFEAWITAGCPES